VRIEHGSTYVLGDFEIRARLVRDPATFDGEVGRPRAAGSIIPDDAFLDLDPLNAIEQQERVYSEIDELIGADRHRRSSVSVPTMRASTWKA
jgi:type VI secretion system protein ImpI